MKQTIEIEVPDGYRVVYNVTTREAKILEIELPKTWEEFCENNPFTEEDVFIGFNRDIIKAYNYVDPKSNVRDDTCGFVLPNERVAKQFIALSKLIYLRDCYRQGWIPNWKDNNNKYVINYCEGKIYYNLYQNTSRILSFQSECIRNIFCKNFRDLIEQAKELL